MPVIFPYIAEFTRNKYRGPYLGVQAFFWTFGRLVCGGFAWIILPLAISRVHSWRVFIALSAVPSLVGALLYFFLPESPRFLLEVRGGREEGEEGGGGGGGGGGEGGGRDEGEGGEGGCEGGRDKGSVDSGILGYVSLPL